MKALLLLLISSSAFACDKSMLLDDVQDLIADKTIIKALVINCKEPDACICVDGWEDGQIRAFGKLRAGKLEENAQKKVAHDAKVEAKRKAREDKDKEEKDFLQKFKDNSASDQDYKDAVKILLGL